MGVQFEWDSRKAAANLRAHKVSFHEAATVLDDDFAVTIADPSSDDEERLVTIGLSSTGSALVVVYTYRGPDLIRTHFGVEGQPAGERRL